LRVQQNTMTATGEKPPLPQAWPTQLEYQDAMANPAQCLSDRALTESVPQDWTTWGVPQPVSGQFANVYRLQHPSNGSLAARVFLRRIADRARHFEALTRHLQTLKQTPACLTPFWYLPEGIKIRQTWFPLLKMPWISGLTLNAAVDKNLYNAAYLATLAEQWRTSVADLERARLVHGDLQHGNILVEDGTDALRLVDYDATWVPSLAGTPKAEDGHPAFQHPQSEQAIGLYADRFPALVMYVSLRVLAVAPPTWFRLHNGDNLLLTRADFTDPQNARGFSIIEAALRGLPKERQLVSVLKAACSQPPTYTPALPDLPV
jgi:hypothetical protein